MVQDAMEQGAVMLDAVACIGCCGAGCCGTGRSGAECGRNGVQWCRMQWKWGTVMQDVVE